MCVQLYMPTRQLVEEKHDRLVERYGGSLGIRDHNAMEYTLVRPLNVLFYSQGQRKDLFDAAAAFTYGIRSSHPFVDGNKRASWLAMQTFLVGNGIDMTIDPVDAEMYMVRLANRELSDEDVAEWLRELLKTGGSENDSD